MADCSQQETAFQLAQQKFDAAHTARDQLNAKIDQVGKDAVAGMLSTWGCILSHIGSPSDLANCVKDMPSEPKTRKQLDELRKEGKVVQARYEQAVDELSSRQLRRRGLVR